LVAGLLLPASLFLVGCNSPLPAQSQNSSGYKIHAPLAETSNIVFVLPVEGMKEPGRLVLADAIAASLRDAARPSVISGKANDQGPTIAGRISEVRQRGSIAWVTAVWELRAPYGTAVANVRHEIVVDSLLWEEGGVEAVNLIVAEAEPLIIGMVADHVGPLTVTDEIAMPPEERFAYTEGTSQTVETPAPLTPVAVEPVSPVVSAPPVVLSAPVVVPPAPVTVPSAPEMAPALNDQKPAMAAGNRLTQADREAAPPAVARQQPLRLLPGDSELAQFGENGDAAGDSRDSDSLDEAAMRQAVNAEPAVLSDVPDNTRVTPISWGRPSFLIRPVTGAPGDGNEVLTSEIKRAMRDQDLTISEDPRQAGYEVLGQVTVGPPVNGRQQARIVWRVMTLDGVEVGKAMQENTVIAGSLNGEWGRVGDIVAQAAAHGIQELFENTPIGAPKARQTPDFTRNPNLQQVPGRAPPPPNS